MIMTQASVTSKSSVFFKLSEKESSIYVIYMQPYNAYYFSIQVNAFW